MVCVLVHVSLWRLFSFGFSFPPLWYHFDFNVPVSAVCIQSWRGQEEKIKRNPSISSRFNGRMSKKRDWGIHRPATLQWENPPPLNLSDNSFSILTARECV
jgi:hypothetical protein